MLNIFLRSIILFVFLLIAMRLMGKRQLGELQPFEFAITLVVAELACIPMADNTIPLVYGIIPIFTLVVMHNLITQLAVKSTRIRKTLNGKPVILISKGVVDCDLLKKCSMNANDLLEGLRSAGYFAINEIEYAILETNGKLSVMPKFANTPVVNADMKINGNFDLPYNIILEGKFMGETLSVLTPAPTKQQVYDLIDKQHLKQTDIFILAISGKNVYIQSYDGKVINSTIEVNG